MALPSIPMLKFELFVKELNQTIKFRPMTIGEKKSLAMAIGMNSQSTISDMLYDILNECTFGKLSLNKLPNHVVEYIYLNIYAHSETEFVKVTYTCQNKVNKRKAVKNSDGDIIEGEFQEFFEACGEEMNVSIPLKKAEILYPENYSPNKTVMVTDTMGMKLKPLSLEARRSINTDEGDVEKISDSAIYACIDSVFDEDKIYTPGDDFTLADFTKWFNDITDGKVAEEVNKFLAEFPQIHYQAKWNCPTCRFAHTATFHGLDDFFG